jgi:hypothetical protein
MNKCLGYITDHRKGESTVLTQKCIEFLIKLGVLCDWYLLIITSYLYSL